jgi:hypothetical protein
MRESSPAELVARSFKEAGIEVLDLTSRQYPDELILIVDVSQEDYLAAQRIGNSLDVELEQSGHRAFVTVRRVPDRSKIAAGQLTNGVADDRAQSLVGLLQARSRAGENQPSLLYIPDSAAGLAKATARRHHLVFGRRGAGKTALLAEAKRLLVAEGNIVSWVNLQPQRFEPYPRIAMSIATALVDSVLSHYAATDVKPQVVNGANSLMSEIAVIAARRDLTKVQVRSIIPKMHQLIKRFTETSGVSLVLIVDDFYFVKRTDQPELLDFLHSISRDSNFWLKIASIRHLTHWFEPSRQMGLQLGQDCDVVDLDVSLQSPELAQGFLEKVLRTYGSESGVFKISSLFSRTALDRLVLASGAVPRDYLGLAAGSVLKAQTRKDARLVGSQDVNRAAGDAATLKLQELEEDLGEQSDLIKSTRRALDVLRSNILEQQRIAYFRISNKDRDDHPRAYELISSLMDVRLIHLLSPSVSEAHTVGEKSEAYLIDLSQYSGDRIMRRLTTLEFHTGKLLLKEPGKAPRPNETARQAIAALRRGPVFNLSLLNEP